MGIANAFERDTVVESETTTWQLGNAFGFFRPGVVDHEGHEGQSSAIVWIG